MALKCNPCDCTSQWYKTDWGWRKAVIDILCQLTNVTPVIGGGATRNDGLANAFAPAIGDASTVAVDSHGGQYLAADGHLPAGTNSIGNIGTVSTVTGVTTVSTVTTVAAVTAITNALPTGTNSIGKISEITNTVTTTPAAAGWTAVSAADITDTTLTTIKAADATNKHYITNVTVSNMHATVATRVDILDGSTVIWQGPCAANGGGFGINFVKPIPGTAATAVKVQCGTTGAAVRASIAGYTAP